MLQDSIVRCRARSGAPSEDDLIGRLTRALLGVVAFLGLSMVAYSIAFEPKTLRLRQFRVGIPGLPNELDGLRVAFLTDFHVGGPGAGAELTREAIEILAQQQPDLVLLGGDFVDEGHWQDDASDFDGLTQFPTVIGVLGNHDHHGGRRVVRSVTRGMAHRGVLILRNEAVSVRVRNVDVTITGIDDPYSGRDDFERAFTGVGWPLILLSHAPVIEEYLRPGMAGMILCGHTHGGQIRLSPASTITPLDATFWTDRLFGRPVSRFQRGFHWAAGNLLYVSNGIGTTRWPIRFMAPPEAAVFHLSAQEPHPDEACDSVTRYIEDIG
jgi:predicted MPP superfamily phosphohydrolase